MGPTINTYLMTAGYLNSIATLLHIGCIYFGAPWYRFFGAGEQMALMAEQGSSYPVVITSAIVLVLSIWALYSFSAAGVILRLPFIKTALVFITAIYAIRTIFGYILIGSNLEQGPMFWFWSSNICLVFTLFHGIGLKQQWTSL